jgi:hypothetical protein
MSSISDDSSAPPDRAPGGSLEDTKNVDGPVTAKLDEEVEVPGGQADDARMLEYLQEAREEEEGIGELANGSTFRKFKRDGEAQVAEALPEDVRAPSSAGSYSTPDDTPSLHVMLKTIALSDIC